MCVSRFRSMCVSVHLIVFKCDSVTEHICQFSVCFESI